MREALNLLKGTQAAVLGGDVLNIAGEKLRFTGDSWHVDKKLGEDIAHFLERSVAESEKYINTYPDPENGTIIYSLVISELDYRRCMGVHRVWPDQNEL